MNAQTSNIEDLLQSHLRRQIFEIVALQADRFSIHNICEELDRRGIKASRNMVQQFLQALLLRGFVRTHKPQDGRKAGRPDLMFEVIQNPQ